MYLKLVLFTCVLAFFAVVFSAYARLSDAGLGCANWPACYQENALKQRQPQQDITRDHSSWRWRLQNLVGALLGILAISICGISWQKHRVLGLSPLLPTILLILITFLAVFGILAFSYLPRPIIVLIHLAGGIAMLILLMQILLVQLQATHQTVLGEMRSLRLITRIGISLLLVEILLGGWVSSNFAGLVCAEFPLCRGLLVPAMDFSYSFVSDGLPLSVERLTAMHWTHRTLAYVALVYFGWLSFRVIAVRELRKMGQLILGLVIVQFSLGVFNVLLGLPLIGAVLHNAVAMLLMVTLLIINHNLRKRCP